VNAKTRGTLALVQFRMDFLMFAPAGARIVLEVDGQHHYASERPAGEGQRRMLPDAREYARTVAASRDLTLAGYEVHRFGAHDLRDKQEARPLVTAFFDSLFRKHHVAVPQRTA
jgi:very-short-patch-repair endonuclease